MCAARASRRAKLRRRRGASWRAAAVPLSMRWDGTVDRRDLPQQRCCANRAKEVEMNQWTIARRLTSGRASDSRRLPRVYSHLCALALPRTRATLREALHPLSCFCAGALWFYATDPRSVASNCSVRADEVGERSSRYRQVRPSPRGPRACPALTARAPVLTAGRLASAHRWIIIVTTAAELAAANPTPSQPSSAAAAATAAAAAVKNRRQCRCRCRC